MTASSRLETLAIEDKGRARAEDIPTTEHDASGQTIQFTAPCRPGIAGLNRRKSLYTKTIPPSIAITWPVIYTTVRGEDSRTMSSTCAARPSNAPEAKAAKASPSFSAALMATMSLSSCAHNGVSTTPGENPFTVMCLSANARAPA